MGVWVVVVFGLLGGCHAGENGRVGGGPLSCKGVFSIPPQSIGVFAHVHKSFTFSDIVLHNCGSEAVILEGIALSGRDAHLRLVGIEVAQISGGVIVRSGDKTFPPDFGYPTQPLRGFKMPATAPGSAPMGVQLILGLEETRLGKHSFGSVDVLYHTDEQRYEYTVPYSLVACSPFETYARHPESCSVTPLAPS